VNQKKNELTLAALIKQGISTVEPIMGSLIQLVFASDGRTPSLVGRAQRAQRATARTQAFGEAAGAVVVARSRASHLQWNFSGIKHGNWKSQKIEALNIFKSSMRKLAINGKFSSAMFDYQRVAIYFVWFSPLFRESP
jgi:hypothetical protein